MAFQATPGTDPALVSQPTPGGGTRGLGESFHPDLNSGTGNYQIPLWSPRGPNQFAPKLSLTYSTGFGNGEFGLGWSLQLMKVTRNSDFGVPTYRDIDDRFYLLDEELAEVDPGIYRHLREERFLRAERHEDGWLVRDRAGFSYHLGVTAAGRETVEIGESQAIFAWLLEEAIDANGNRIRYRYFRDGGRLYLADVSYGIYRISFDYESRPDPISDARRGVQVVTKQRCRAIRYFIERLQAAPVRVYSLGYRQDSHANISLLSSFAMTGIRVDREKEDRQSAPRLQFAYTEFDPSSRRYQSFETLGSAEPPPSVGDANTELVDLLGDGLPDVVELRGGGSRWWQNLGGGRWAAPRPLPSFPAAVQLGARNIAFADLTGTCTADLLNLEDAPFGIYINEPGKGWTKRHAYRHRPPFDLSDPELRLVDLDGDGRIDAIRSSGRCFYLFFNRFGAGNESGSEWSPAMAVPRQRDRAIWPDVSFSDPRVKLADLNGDGLIDIVLVHAGQIDFWPYLGNGRWSRRQTLFLSDMPRRNVDPERFFISDINGDGASDFIYVDPESVYFWVNRGGLSVSSRMEVAFTPSAAGASIRLADLLGNGTCGVVWTYPFSRLNQRNYKYLDFTDGVKPYLLNQIDHGSGKITDIRYRSSASYAREAEASGHPWKTSLPFPLQVVSEVIERDTLANSSKHRRFVYRDGRFDGDQRRFIGFGQTETIDVGDETIPSLRTVTTFEQGVGMPSARAMVLARHPLRLEIYGQDVNSLTEHLFRTETNTWEAIEVATTSQGLPILHSRLVHSIEEKFEGEETPRMRMTQLEYDRFGNVIDKREILGPQVGADVLRTQISYATGEERWLLDHQSEVVRTDGAGTLLGLQRFYYDGPEFEGLPLGQIERGNLTRSEELVLTPELRVAAYGTDQPDWAALGYRAVTLPDGRTGLGIDNFRRRFDDRGNLIASRDPLGHESQIDYDVDGIYPIASRNALNQETQHLYDPIAGYPALLRDPNGAAVVARFDSLGRTVAQIRPGDTEELPTVVFEYLDESLPLGVVARSRVTSGKEATIDQASYYDGEGRLLEQRARFPAGRIKVGPGPRYNARNLERFRPLPFFAEGGMAFSGESGVLRGGVSMRYDAMGRLKESTSADGAVARAVFRREGIDRFNVNDTDSTPDNIARGQFNTPTTEEFDLHGRLVRVIERDPTGEQITRYNYDGNNHLVSITDAREVVIAHYLNDLSGRRLLVEHVDAGTHRLIYDAAGQKVQWITPRTETIETRYDPIGRVMDVWVNGGIQERFIYDTGNGSNLRTRLAVVEDALGVAEFGYDARGRVLRRKFRIDDAVHEFRYEYDAADRVLAVHYPNGETVQYEYDAGKLVHIPGWVENINYALLDQLQRLSLANGIVHEYEYNPVSFRVDAMTVRASQGGEPLVRLAYEYDRIGNPLRITDRNSRREAYSYDSFGRLVGVSGDIFNETFAYDSAGNFLQNDGFRSGQLAVAPGTNRILGSAGSSTPQFDYELGGEIRRSPGRTFRFDARGRLVLASTDAGMHCEFTYTYDGRVGRTRRTGGKVIETLCLQPDYEIRDGEPTIHISINGQRIGRLSAGQRTYLHPDYRGAIVAVTNQAGEIVAVTNYRPFGAVATTSGSAENASFLGIDIEQVVGVVQLGARWYDPVLGRFISPDQLVLFEPERVLNTPQALNLYVYALNNPMVMTDSTGRLPEWAHWLIGGIILLALTVATVGVGAAAGVAVGAAAGALEAATNILFAASVGSGLGGLYGIASAKLRGGDTAKGFLAGTVVGAIAGALGATDVFLELPIAGAIYNSEIIVYSVAFGATQGATAGLIDRDYGGGGFRGALDAVANVLVGMLIGSATGATGGLLLTVATMSSDILIPIVGVQVVTALATYPTEYVLSDRLLERQRQGDDFRSSSRAERLLPETTASAASGTEAGGGTSYAGRRVDRAIQEALGVS